jgi:predicted outer membrane repeat protein
VLLVFVCLASASAADNNQTEEAVAIDEEIASADILAEENDDAGTFTDLNSEIAGHENEVTLKKNYAYDWDIDPDTCPDAIVINKDNFTIDGAGHTIDAMNHNTVFNVQAKNVTLKNIIFLNSFGTAVDFQGAGTIINSTFMDCSGTAAHFQSVGTIINSTFMDCSGTAAHFQSTGTIRDSSFINQFGDAVYFQDNGTVENSIFTGNMGRGIRFGGDATVINSTFKNNHAYGGGAIEFNGNATVVNSTFINNYATTTFGGAICLFEYGTVINCRFTDNHAPKGGAIYFSRSANVFNSTFENNYATDGGAVYFHSDGGIYDSTFTNGHAANGGAIYFEKNGMVNNTRLTGNDASKNGGAIYSLNDLNISNSILDANAAPNIYYNVYIDSNAALTAVNVTPRTLIPNFKSLSDEISQCEDSIFVLDMDYFYTPASSQLGIEVRKDNFTIDGAGHTLDAQGTARIFNIQGENVTLKNFYFVNGRGYDGAVFFSSFGTVLNSMFYGNSMKFGGGIYFGNGGVVMDCSFEDNCAMNGDGGAIYSNGNAFVER